MINSISTPLPGILDNKNVSAGNAAPLQTARLYSKATAAVAASKSADPLRAQTANAQTVSKMKLYRPAYSLGIPTERGKGSFAAPIRLSYAADNVGGASASSSAKEYGGCRTCSERAYKDGSDDPGVSFQTATSVPASTAGIAVASHEGEHVTRETAKAGEEGRIVTQSKVTFQYACCPECHKMYIAGGTTSISTMSDPKAETQSGSLAYAYLGERKDAEL